MTTVGEAFSPNDPAGPEPTVLVTGAGGFVGRHLVARLAADGYRVVRLSRGGVSGEDGAFAGPADLADIEAFASWPAGIGAVVHLAALNPGGRDPASRDLQALRHANVDATTALARRAAREGVGRMVLAGSSAVHAMGGPGPVSETAPFALRTPYAISKAEAEAQFWDALRGSGMSGCVLRPAPIFGPGARNLTAGLVRLARSPLPLPLRGLGAPRSLVSVDSVAGAIALCLAAQGAADRTFLLADDGPLTPAGIVSALRDGWGRRPGLLPAPVRLAASAARLFGRGDAWSAATAGAILDTRSIRDTLGWHPPRAADALGRMAKEARI